MTTTKYLLTHDLNLQWGIITKTVGQQDVPPAQYFLKLKMERAKDYLQNTTLSCKEIAYRLGFDSASYFNKTFRVHQGTTPMEFRSTRDVQTVLKV